MLQHGAGFSQAIDVWSEDLFATVETAVGVTEVVNQEEDDVRLGRGAG